ncbi:hypothetical protein, partial [Marinimicrobium sp. C2-29]|uniref:hypothetical protein n=1 Tax=Marinimicrobium sp. C2-29 TaxID=3139825 RepID=UPI003138AA06
SKKFQKALARSGVDPYSSPSSRDGGKARRTGRSLKNFLKIKGLQAKVKMYNAQLLRDKERIERPARPLTDPVF